MSFLITKGLGPSEKLLKTEEGVSVIESFVDIVLEEEIPKEITIPEILIISNEIDVIDITPTETIIVEIK